MGIGTSQLTAPRLEGEDIVAEVVTEYAGREIGRSRRPLSGTLLREALASLILSGSLFSEAGEQLTRAIDAWTLHCTVAALEQLEGATQSPWASADSAPCFLIYFGRLFDPFESASQPPGSHPTSRC